ncbi:hypothetical protein NERG_00074 [Nematocida ausubeli]|uniref:Uncharacterized protein n=1 Tax=Nematocida ausubeli (strain ATCC PRA-371 / ERTm2) TaxID=1913371 RepID=H8Z903_NEMA1|nr:hypothetical protein NERG_00074 [Nematocida ausubeli]
MEKIAQILDEEGVEVYYSNLLIDKAFKKTGRAISATVVLVVDEFEGGPKRQAVCSAQGEAGEAL